MITDDISNQSRSLDSLYIYYNNPLTVDYNLLDYILLKTYAKHYKEMDSTSLNKDT